MLGIHAVDMVSSRPIFLRCFGRELEIAAPTGIPKNPPYWNSHEITKLVRRPYGASRCAGQEKNYHRAFKVRL